MSQHVEQLDDGTWVGICPFKIRCGATFEAETEEEAVHLEGVHRAKEHTDPQHEINHQSEQPTKNIIKEKWD